VIAAFNDIPVKTVNGRADLRQERRARRRRLCGADQRPSARDGRRAILMTILKAEGASTLSVVQRVRDAPARHRGTAAAGV